MKILIVNGYSKSSAGIQNFSDFQYFIQKSCPIKFHSSLNSLSQGSQRTKENG